jgi:hypothetical protein
MPGWTIETLPPGFTVSHAVDNSLDTGKEWYSLQAYGRNSGRLCIDSPTFQADLDTFVDAAIPPLVRATNQGNILHQRNRWLAQTDPYVLPVPSLPADMPQDVLTAISDKNNQAAIMAWRQALRDYPLTVTDWARPPALPPPPPIPLPSGRQLIIVT